MNVSLSHPCLNSNSIKLRQKTSRNRSRSWCFTWNNYTTEDLSQLSYKKFLPTEIDKLIFQEEIGGKKKVKHIQGFVQFKNQIDFNVIQKYLPESHVEKCRNIQASIKYCLKKDTASGIQYTYGISEAELIKINRPRLTQDEILTDMYNQMHDEIMNGDVCFTCGKKYEICQCDF